MVFVITTLKRTRRLALILPVCLWLAPLPGNAVPLLSAPDLIIEEYATGLGATTGIAIAAIGDIYTTDYDGGRVLRIVPGSDQPEVYATGIPFPTDITFSTDGRLFVTSSTGASSDVVEVSTDGTVSVFATGFSYPTSIEAFGDDLFVTNSGDGTISRIDSAGTIHPFLSGLSAPNGPYGVSFDEFGDLYFTDHATGGVYSSDLLGNTTLLGALSPLGATYTAVSADNELFVSDVVLGDVYRFDGQDFSLFASGFAGKSNPPFIGPLDMAFDDYSNMYVNDGSSLWRISPVQVNEPATFMLVLIGLALLGSAQRRL